MIIAHAKSSSELLKTFNAPDPWNGGRRATFSIHRHFMGGLMPGYAAADKRSRLQSCILRCQADQRDRPLPDALVSLWLDDKVPSDRLPQLLAGLEPQLKRSDYVSHQALNPMQRAVRRWAPMLFAAFVALLGLSMLGEDSGTGVVMLAVGLLVGAGAWLVGRRFRARRQRQVD